MEDKEKFSFFVFLANLMNFISIQFAGFRIQCVGI